MFFIPTTATIFIYSKCVCVRAGAGQLGDGGALAVPADRAIAQAEGKEGWEEESVVHGELLCIDTNDSKLQSIIPTSATWLKFSYTINLLTFQSSCWLRLPKCTTESFVSSENKKNHNPQTGFFTDLIYCKHQRWWGNFHLFPSKLCALIEVRT